MQLSVSLWGRGELGLFGRHSDRQSWALLMVLTREQAGELVRFGVDADPQVLKLLGLAGKDLVYCGRSSRP